MQQHELTIARLEREQKHLIDCLSLCLDSMQTLIAHADIGEMHHEDLIFILESQKQTMIVLSNILDGE